MVQKFMVEKFGVEESGVEKSGVELSFNRQKVWPNKNSLFFHENVRDFHHSTACLIK